MNNLKNTFEWWEFDEIKKQKQENFNENTEFTKANSIVDYSKKKIVDVVSYAVEKFPSVNKEEITVDEKDLFPDAEDIKLKVEKLCSIFERGDEKILSHLNKIRELIKEGDIKDAFFMFEKMRWKNNPEKNYFLLKNASISRSFNERLDYLFEQSRAIND